jgi:hypothetical protein
MNVVIVIAGIITAAAALVTVFFAWKASKESKIATQAAQETANVAAAAAREFWALRHQDHLRAIAHYIADIARQADEIESTALDQAEAGHTEWQSPEQEHLGISIQGMRIPLPLCRDLAQPLGQLLLKASNDERKGLMARMAAEAAQEVEHRPELYAPVMDPIADTRPDGTVSGQIADQPRQLDGA